MRKINIPLELHLFKNSEVLLCELDKLPFDFKLQSEIDFRVRSILNEIMAERKEVSDIVLVSYKVFIPLSNYLYWKLFQEKSKNLGFKLIIDSYTNNILNEIDLNNKKHTSYFSLINLKKILYNRIRIIIRNLYLIRPRYFFKPVLVHNSYTNSLAASLFPRNRVVFFSYNYWNIEKVNNYNSRVLIESLVDVTLKKYLILADSYKIYLDKDEILKLKSILSNRFMAGISSLAYVKSLNISKYHALLIDAPRNEINKSIALKFIDERKYVYEILHGHQHVIDWDYYSWAEFPFITNLITMATNSRDFNYLIEKYGVLRNTLVSFISNNQNKISHNKKFLKHGKKYLLIGAPYKRFGNFSQSSKFQEIQQYVIEKNIVNYFDNKNFEVFYKVHPEGLYKEKVEFLWGQKLVVGKLEFMHNHFDGFIFYYTNTSFFNTAIFSNKPIYIIDCNFEQYAPDTNNFILNRCEVLKYEDIL
jgi:hypothetical protein